jgi:hypothetical protein
MLQVMKTAAMTAAVSTTESKRPRLAFFQQSVLSLARQWDGLSVNHPEKAAFHKGRVMDLWNLFPCFCLHPGDLETAFPVLSPILIRAMSDKRYHPHLVVSCDIAKKATQNTLRPRSNSLNDVLIQVFWYLLDHCFWRFDCFSFRSSQ